MKTRFSTIWWLRLMTFAVWLLVALSCVFWAMKFVTTTPVKATTAPSSAAALPDSKAIAKLLGATNSIATQAVNTATSSNYALFGVVSYGLKTGVALIAADGKPARPFRVGSKVADDWVLKSVTRTAAVLASSMTAADGLKLELPTRRPAATSQAAPTSFGAAAATSSSANNAYGSAPLQPMAAQAVPVAAIQSPIQSAVAGMTAAPAASNSGANSANTPAATPSSAPSPQVLRPISRFAPQNASDMTREVPRIPLPASAQP